MNRQSEKRLEADTRTPREKLYHLLYACSKEDLAWVESKIKEQNLYTATPLIFCTRHSIKGSAV